jgi:hypothetical protein
MKNPCFAGGRVRRVMYIRQGGPRHEERRHAVIPFHNIPDSDGRIPPLVRAIRLVIQVVRPDRREAVFSWVVWLLGVGAFAVWTLHHYHAPGDVPWIGMTIHTCVFAAWTLVLREWLVLHIRDWQDRRSRQERDSHHRGL